MRKRGGDGPGTPARSRAGPSAAQLRPCTSSPLRPSAPPRHRAAPPSRNAPATRPTARARAQTGSSEASWLQARRRGSAAASARSAPTPCAPARARTAFSRLRTCPTMIAFSCARRGRAAAAAAAAGGHVCWLLLARALRARACALRARARVRACVHARGFAACSTPPLRGAGAREGPRSLGVARGARG